MSKLHYLCPEQNRKTNENQEIDAERFRTINTKEINLYVILAGTLATILLAWIANKILNYDTIGFDIYYNSYYCRGFPRLAIY